MLQDRKLRRILLTPDRPLPQVVTLPQERQDILENDPGLLEAGSDTPSPPPEESAGDQQDQTTAEATAATNPDF